MPDPTLRLLAQAPRSATIVASQDSTAQPPLPQPPSLAKMQDAGVWCLERRAFRELVIRRQRVKCCNDENGIETHTAESIVALFDTLRVILHILRL